MLKAIYTFFLGLLLALFVGLGVSSFYPEPKAPVYPDNAQTVHYDDEQAISDSTKLDQEKWDHDYQEYTKALQRYDRNVSIIVLSAAVVMLVLSLVLQKRIDMLSDGLLLGGVFTLVYSIFRSFSGNDNRYSFAVVSVGLILTMVLGYIKFIHPQTASTPKAKKK